MRARREQVDEELWVTNLLASSYTRDLLSYTREKNYINILCSPIDSNLFNYFLTDNNYNYILLF